MIAGEEVNFLIYQYLEETGYKHTAFMFDCETRISRSSCQDRHIPPGMLLMYLEKALLLLQMEMHLDKDEEFVVCNQPFSLLNPHRCAYKSRPAAQARESLASELMSTPSTPLHPVSPHAHG